MFYKFGFFVCCLLSSLALSSPTQASLIFDDAHKIVGATDVVANGLTYDLKVVVGSCDDVYGGCGQFINADWPKVDPYWLFSGLDDMIKKYEVTHFEPLEFRGDTPRPQPCGGTGCDYLHIVHSFLYYRDSTGGGLPIGELWIDGIGTDLNSVASWAVWTPARSRVPEPFAFILLTLGGMAVFLSRYRRKL